MATVRGGVKRGRSNSNSQLLGLSPEDRGATQQSTFGTGIFEPSLMRRRRRGDLAHAEIGHMLGTGGEAGWCLGTHVWQQPDTTVRADNDHGMQISENSKSPGTDVSYVLKTVC